MTMATVEAAAKTITATTVFRDLHLHPSAVSWTGSKTYI